MSLQAKAFVKNKSAIRDRIEAEEALNEIKAYLEGTLLMSDRPWELSYEEAVQIADSRDNSNGSFEQLISELKDLGKSAGARYIACRIWNGADPDCIEEIASEWYAHRNIRRELSKEEMKEIGASVSELRYLGIKRQREAREFYNLYKEVRVKDRVFNSCKQVDLHRVKALSLTANYNRLPMWVKKAIINSDWWIESHDREDVRIGDIWRLAFCAKAWKHSPSLPKAIAEKVGKMPVKTRILSKWAWRKKVYHLNGYYDAFKSLHENEWQVWQRDERQPVSRQDLTESFWRELRRLDGLNLSRLIEEVVTDENFCLEDHNSLRNLAEIELGLPRGYLFEAWGRHRNASKLHYLDTVINSGSDNVCLNLFGSDHPAIKKAFQESHLDAWRWASAVCDQNPGMIQKVLAIKPGEIIEFKSEFIEFLLGLPLKFRVRLLGVKSHIDAWRWASTVCENNVDMIQKVLAMKEDEMIAFEPEAVNFLMTLPLNSRVRMLGVTTFKYRGEVNPITKDHVRDCGYLWSNIRQKPDLGRVRCWFSVHEQLAAAFVKELPDEPLPIPSGWGRLDGLCSVDGTWELEFPRRVATLKYWGQHLKNCVGGYGPAIKQGRSVIFAVKEKGLITHCVEMLPQQDNGCNQFYGPRNSSPDEAVKESVLQALKQAGM